MNTRIRQLYAIGPVDDTRSPAGTASLAPTDDHRPRGNPVSDTLGDGEPTLHELEIGTAFGGAGGTRLVRFLRRQLVIERENAREAVTDVTRLRERLVHLRQLVSEANAERERRLGELERRTAELDARIAETDRREAEIDCRKANLDLREEAFERNTPQGASHVPEVPTSPPAPAAPHRRSARKADIDSSIERLHARLLRRDSP